MLPVMKNELTYRQRKYLILILSKCFANVITVLSCFKSYSNRILFFLFE